MNDEELLRGLREMADVFGQELSPPATPDQLAESERLLGYPLPPFLRRVYAELCNGGVGAGADWRDCWLSGVVGGAGNDWGINAIDDYLDARRDVRGDPPTEWPTGLLPVAHHGGGVSTCVDCTCPAGVLVTYENREPDDRYTPACFRRRDMTIRDWLASWLGGPGAAQNQQGG